jgi:hypothetical protein
MEIKSSKKPYKFTKTQLKWLEALESGEYKRCKGVLCEELKNGTCTYCCLGVASEILLSSTHKEKLDNFPNWLFDGEDTECPTSVMDRLKLHGSLGEFFEDGENYTHEFTMDGTIVESHSLAELNDEGWSFKKIAAFIRKNPRLIFRD